ncbi:MAG: HD domain-containing protein [Chloroflexi bacterium]|nr:HD domain-containing protein [Chloroflexota bacterium]
MFYRLRQVWWAVTGEVDNKLRTEALASITSAACCPVTCRSYLQALFLQMSRPEQRHALAVWQQVRSQESQNSELLIAALLHDVGKSTATIRLHHRILTVIAGRIGEKVPFWLAGPLEPFPKGWRRPFHAYVYHPEIGARLLAQADCCAKVVDLVRRHQGAPIMVHSIIGGQHLVANPSLEEAQLATLKIADNLN